MEQFTINLKSDGDRTPFRLTFGFSSHLFGGQLGAPTTASIRTIICH
jgi:hypothetical protein